MDDLHGYEKLQAAMAEFASAYLDPLHQADKLGKLTSPPSDMPIFEKVFYGFTEISDTIDALKLIESLISIAPPKHSSIKKNKYLQFLIGAYLQEVYILEQRLVAYVKKMGRMYNQLGTTQKLVDSTHKVFKSITSVRGSHVHEYRYSDRELEGLAALTLVASFKIEFQDEADFEYIRAKEKWKKTIKTNNAETNKFINKYCDTVFTIITTSAMITLPIAKLKTTKSARRAQ